VGGGVARPLRGFPVFYRSSREKKKSAKNRKIFTGYEPKKGTPLGAKISRVCPDKNYISPTESSEFSIRQILQTVD
jgi:hypothetical protein